MRLVAKGKLELTWVGKDERPQLEPRVLVEGPAKSYGDPAAENTLIFGDNLLALKALEQDFAGKIRCICIDPSYNTGAAWEHDEDGLEHSLWLTMMRDRLEMIRGLLSVDGSLWIAIDDNEVAAILERDPAVQRWIRPPEGNIPIYWRGRNYNPDFVIETEEKKYLVEIKRRKDIGPPMDAEVREKALAALRWCKAASDITGGKPWEYKLIPDDAVQPANDLLLTVSQSCRFE